MQETSLLRKVVGPTLPAVLLHRTALVTQLQEAIAPEPHTDNSSVRHQLVLCCAPAGYGKTTLLADFACAASLTCCWYFLDRADTDPIVFLRTLLASLRYTFPHFGVSLDPMFHPQFPDSASSTVSTCYALLDALCAALTSEISERFALILSNYEEINESDTLTNLVNYLLKKFPPWAILIIESRIIPDISFTSFVIRDAMCGLDTNALRFSAQDIAELAKLQGLPSLTDAEAEQLAVSFDGWIAGILLGTRVGDARFRLLTQSASHTARFSSWPEKSSAKHHLTEQQRNMLFTYVVDEVLKRDTAVHQFLQTISILQQIEPTMCNTLLNITDASERLAHLERQGLFLTLYENTSSTMYTCHPAVRELLSEQLRHQDPERFTALHRQAAELWHAIHNNEQAIYHALAIGAYDMVVSFVLNAARQLMQQGLRETMARWLYSLPSSVRESHAQILVLQAYLFLESGQHAPALPLLARAETLVQTATGVGTETLPAFIAILRSKALYQQGAYPQVQELCHLTLQQLPAHEYALRSAAEMRLGICANLQGKFALGITHLQQALHIWANQPPLNQAIEIHSALANTYYLTGNFLLAKHHLAAMLDACEHLHDIPGKESALILQGLIAQDQGLVVEAEATFLQALTLARTVSYAQRGEAYALVNLGSLSLEQGQYIQALTYAEQGLTLARTFGNRSLINDALMCRALSYLFLGDPTSALLTVDQMEAPVLGEGVVGYERVWHDLTSGMIFLIQKRYNEAVTCLAAIEAALHMADLKRGTFQAKLRLAACRVALDMPEEAVRLLEEVAVLLLNHRTYIHLVQIELQWLSVLLPVVQKHSRLASLRTLLGLAEEPPQIQTEHKPSPTVPAKVSIHSPRLTICAFGEPAVVLDGQAIKRWRLTSVTEIFFFLLDSHHPVSKEAILTALWPEYDEQTTRSFHNTIYYLRKLFGEACVVFHPTGYSLDLAACYGKRVWYDVQIFQQQRIEAERALIQKDEMLAKETLLNMVQLYRGDYGSSFYHDWCTFRRDELRMTYLEARRQLAQIAWRAEAWDESIGHFRQMLCIDNCLEEVHYGLMRCYLRQGKRGAALRQYHSCQEILQEELGVQPGQTIQNLYQRLMAKQCVE